MFGWSLIRTAELRQVQAMAEVSQALVDVLALRLKEMVEEQKVTNLLLKKSNDRLAVIQTVVEEQTSAILELVGLSTLQNRNLDGVVQLLSQIQFQAFPPGPVRVELRGEEHRGNGMADLTIFDVPLPALPELHDVVKRHVTVTVDGVEILTAVAAPTDEVISGLKGPQHKLAEITLQDEDEAGLLSPVSSVTAILNDTTPPAAPGEFGIVITGEEHVADEPPVEEPPVEEPPVEEPPVEEPPVEEPPVEEPPVEETPVDEPPAE